jgi:DNA-binding NarL/FixJ family response regulator
VIIADDEVLLRDGLSRLLGDAGVDVVAAVGTPDELRSRVAFDRPDAVIVDIRMPPTHTDEGLSAARDLRASYPRLGILVLSHYLDSRYAVMLMEGREGGVGYLLKERVSDVAVLVDALMRVVEGECVIDPTITARLIRRKEETLAIGTLTKREREVLSLMAEGRSNPEICRLLFLSTKTVEAHVRQIFQKFGLREEIEGHRRVLAVLEYLRAVS